MLADKITVLIVLFALVLGSLEIDWKAELSSKNLELLIRMFASSNTGTAR